MTNSRTRPSATPTLSTIFVLGLAALGATGCGNDRHAAEARRALGTQLGSLPPGRAGVPGAQMAQVASADDLSTARRYLEATLRLDPTNAAARAALAGLGPNPDVDPALLDVAPMPGPVASRATPSRIVSSLSRVAFGEVGAFGADLADAVRPWTRVASAASPAPRTAADSAEALAAFVGARSVAADAAARDSAARPARRLETRARVVAVRRRPPSRSDASLAAREDSVSRADSVLVAAARWSAEVDAPRPKHKRTWPWTRAQRWLVAKGLGGGAGAGVVVGAIVGNIPGALIAGSIGGGALGFKKATRIGPAAPYPSARDSAAFDVERRERDLKAGADTARVALRP